MEVLKYHETDCSSEVSHSLFQTQAVQGSFDKQLKFLDTELNRTSVLLILGCSAMPFFTDGLLVLLESTDFSVSCPVTHTGLSKGATFCTVYQLILFSCCYPSTCCPARPQDHQPRFSLAPCGYHFDGH